MKKYDIVIIGGGPGGYVAALYASRRKASVCVIEKDLVGGTCLNRGCIPTKSLINSAATIYTVNDARRMGLDGAGYALDFPKAVARKDEVVLRLRTGIETLFRANKIDLVKAVASLNKSGDVVLDGSERIGAANIIIAAGSRAASLPNVSVDELSILSSDGILNMSSVPGSIVIIGGGVIGCEFASLYNALGAKVTIVEAAATLLPGLSGEISRKLEAIFKKRGCDVRTNARVESAAAGRTVRLSISDSGSIEADRILVSVGRTANIEPLGLEDAGIPVLNGRIKVDGHLRTDRPGVYAIGDCVAGPQLAHKASYDGILACDNIMGSDRCVDYSNIPNCIWTEPEIATVGLSEDEARSRYQDIRTGKFPYLASGKAYLEGRTEGFAKIIGTQAGEILGVEIMGRNACEIINEAVLAKTMKVNVKEWSRVVHAHPTISEILQEAAEAFCGMPIHSI